MALDLTLYLDDHPGELAPFGAVLDEAGVVNIEGFCAVTSSGDQPETHVLVQDMDLAFKALARAGIGLAYLATGTRLVLAAHDLARAEAELA